VCVCGMVWGHDDTLPASLWLYLLANSSRHLLALEIILLLQILYTYLKLFSNANVRFFERNVQEITFIEGVVGGRGCCLLYPND